MDINTILINNSITNSKDEYNKVFDLVYGNVSNQTINLDSSFLAAFSNKLVPWINPYDFDSNISKTIEMLESVESLHKELSSIIFQKIQLHFIEDQFKDKSSVNYDLIFKTDSSYTKQLKIDEHLKSILLRIKIKEIDLIEYFKSVIHGARELYNIETNDLELVEHVTNDLKLVIKIRELLRKIVLKHREVKLNEFITIVPISLKTSKSKSDNYVCEFGSSVDGPIESIQNLGSAKSIFNVNLTDFEYLKKYDSPNGIKHKVKRIGFNVVDRLSRTAVPPPPQGKDIGDVRGLNVQAYEIILEDKSTLIPDSQPVSVLQRVPKFSIGMIPGHNNFDNITWVKSKGIINFNADRKWNLHFSCPTQPRFPKSNLGEIYDIQLFFQISYLKDAIN